MTRTQIAIFVCLLHALTVLLLGGSLIAIFLLAVFTCGPLLLHYLFNQQGKRESQ